MKVKNKSRKAISLFSGCGGMDIGVKTAGFHVLACIEIDKYCCETLQYNIEKDASNTKVYHKDIREINPNDLMHDLNIKKNELDLLFGGPPCQAFSQIGKQKSLEDERGMLLFQIPRFAEILLPKSILIEQVAGLLSAKGYNGNRGEVFELFIKELESLGYIPKWKTIMAADHGVAQLRKRLFIVATLGKNGFDFPQPTHSSDGEESLFPLPKYKTVGEALKGLGKPSKKNEINRDDSHVDVTPKGDLFRINGVPEGSFLAAQTHLPKEQVRNLTKKDTTKFLRLSRKKPSNTLRCGEIFFHPTQNRYLTPREYMRIHGYPDDYKLKGPIKGRSGVARFLDQHRQIANSVPPPIAEEIAKKILDII